MSENKASDREDAKRRGKPVSDGSFLCAVDAALSVVGGKWKLIIVWELLQEPLRHGELLRLLPGVSPKVLTQQLRELEADGIVTRTVHRQVPPKVVYAISDFGRTLSSLAELADEWGRTHAETLLKNREAYKPD